MGPPDIEIKREKLLLKIFEMKGIKMKRENKNQADKELEITLKD